MHTLTHNIISYLPHTSPRIIILYTLVFTIEQHAHINLNFMGGNRTSAHIYNMHNTVCKYIYDVCMYVCTYRQLHHLRIYIGSYFTVRQCMHTYHSTTQSINQSMALSASCAGHTRAQSYACNTIQIVNEVIAGW